MRHYDTFKTTVIHNLEQMIMSIETEMVQIAKITPKSVTLADLIEGWLIAEKLHDNTNAYRKRNCQTLWLNATEAYDNEQGYTPHGDLSQTLIAWEAWIEYGGIENQKLLVKERDAIKAAMASKEQSVPSQR